MPNPFGGGPRTLCKCKWMCSRIFCCRKTCNSLSGGTPSPQITNVYIYNVQKNILFICICIYVYIYIYIHICTCVYICVCVYIQTYTYIISCRSFHVLSGHLKGQGGMRKKAMQVLGDVLSPSICSSPPKPQWTQVILYMF